MKRFRQYRTTQAVRDQWADVAEPQPQDFIYPYFVVEGKGVKEEIGSMRGVYHFSIDTLIEDIAELLALGIDKVLLFGVVPQEEKDERGSLAYSPDSIVARAVRAVKEALPGVTVFTDVCLCGYTSHGHCGLLASQEDSSRAGALVQRLKGSGGMVEVDNDATLPLLAEMAYQHALAGADWVAPSAMMDGQVEAIRQRLDSDERTRKTRIMGYSAKYASAYYGPFRDAAHSAPGFGDRRSYQMDYRTRDQGLEEIEADIEEGADWVMVKPAMAYLDIIERATDRFTNHPMVAYQVSGEYSMLLNASRDGLFDEWNIFHESLTAIRRAGAQYIISYYAKRYALLTNQH